MRRHYILSCLAGVALFLVVGITTAETIRITNGEWPPFTSEQLPYNGPLSRIVLEAFALEGVSVEYGYFPWKRAYENAKTGKWDGSVGWAPSSKHLQDFYMSKPVISVNKALFHLKNTPFDWKSIDDLGKWRLGATAGYSYGDEWDQAVKFARINVEEVTADEQNIRKLLLKRIDAFVMEVDVANYLIRKLLTPEEAALITSHPKRVVETSICLALPRQLEISPSLLIRFNHGLQRLKDSGKYNVYLRDIR